MFFFTDELQHRYNELDTQIKSRSQLLQNALTQSQDIQDSLDLLLRWLDEAERNVHKMEKGTVLVIKKEPLVENMQVQKVGFSILIQGLQIHCLKAAILTFITHLT